MLVAIVLGIVAMMLAAAALYDQRMRRRGVAVRSGLDVLDEAVHHRADIDAVPYEPARRAGQRDWATYRRRDKKRSRPA